MQITKIFNSEPNTSKFHEHLDSIIYSLCIQKVNYLTCSVVKYLNRIFNTEKKSTIVKCSNFWLSFKMIYILFG